MLDDGWFRGRRDDHAGLGDWYVDETVWPDGLTPADRRTCTRRGMEFGLWVEPEMVNVDSDLARAHPDWIVAGRAAPRTAADPRMAPPAGDRPREPRRPGSTCSTALDALLTENTSPT